MAKQNPEKSDFESNVLYIAIGGAIFVLLIWLLVGAQIVAIIGILRKYELVPFTYFFEGAAVIHDKLAVLDGRVLDLTNSLGMLNESGHYVRWLYVPLLPVLAFLLLIKSTRLRFQKQHTMASLTKQESIIWPEIGPVVGKQDLLLSGDEHSGEWAVPLTEWEFAEKYKLANRNDLKLDRDATRKIFIQQLGPLWHGPNHLPPHRKAFYAALLLAISTENNDAEKGQAVVKLRHMAKTFTSGGMKGMDTSFADAVIAKYGNLPRVQRAISQHAYVLSVFSTLLQVARSDGVLASPMWIWMRTVDRTLWYMLNNVGRYAFHVECAGAAAHWLFEKTVGQSCHTPMVEKAIDGLALALTEFTEDDQVDRLYR